MDVSTVGVEATDIIDVAGEASVTAVLFKAPGVPGCCGEVMPAPSFVGPVGLSELAVRLTPVSIVDDDMFDTSNIRRFFWGMCKWCRWLSRS